MLHVMRAKPDMGKIKTAVDAEFFQTRKPLSGGQHESGKQAA